METLPVIFHEAYEVDIGPHVFPTAKYRLIRARLLEDAVITEQQLRRPEPADDGEVGLVHTAEYVHKIKTGDFTIQEAMMLEVPFTPELREASWLCARGTTLAGRLALERGFAAHLGGGFHHAFPDHGEGFCLINDVAIAVRALRREGAIDRAIVIDCDVHHGNGTAAIFSGESEVFTFSMHQEHNYPAWKPPSDLDLGLADGTGDAEYLSLLDKQLPSTLEDHGPDLAFYLAGADPYREDQLGGLGLSLDGLRQRDELVLRLLGDAGVPVATVLAGGYALRTDDTVEIHCETVRAAARAMGGLER
jgi:acetoin utilization deacetylase AcuC-like enzyme